MRRAMLAFGMVLSFCSISLSFAADTQQTGRVWRIGILGNIPSKYWEAFQQALQDRGYTEGRNVAFERRYAEGRPALFPGLAAELVGLKLDVMVVSSGPGVQAAKKATETIPIVMISVSNPVGRGLVANLGHPGGNITGTTEYTTDLVPKRLEMLKAAVPTASRVVIIRCLKCEAVADAAGVRSDKGDEAAAARTLGMTLIDVDLSDTQDFEDSTAAAIRAHPDALFLLSSAPNFALRKELADFAIRQRLPEFAPVREHVVAGALMSFGLLMTEGYREAAVYVDKILKGAKPGDLPVEQPTKFELVINLKTAKALGLTIPQALLLRADEVIQ